MSRLLDYEGSRDNLHLVERFVPAGPGRLIYRVTVEDSTVFTQPWTIEIPMTRWDDGANQIYESACHEGNYALTSILNGRPSAGPVGWTGMDEEDE